MYVFICLVYCTELSDNLLPKVEPAVKALCGYCMCCEHTWTKVPTHPCMYISCALYLSFLSFFLFFFLQELILFSFFPYNFIIIFFSFCVLHLGAISE